VRIEIHVFAPGRVNLIGEHTDHAGGLAMPMAIDLGTTVVGRADGSGLVALRSGTEDHAAIVPLDIATDDLRTISPAWARYVAGVVHEVRPMRGFDGTVTTTLPVGAGLSSSAALEVAVALALGHDGDALDLAQRCQRAEQLASGVPCGVMDQWASAAGVEGHALLMDFTAMTLEPVPLPDGATIVVVHSGEQRALAGSPYAQRRAACERAATIVGPLHDATVASLDAIDDRDDRRRAHHVVTENERVVAFAAALRAADLDAAGRLMVESHRSLRDDFEVSTPTLDALVERLTATPGVHGARLTGAGFGGCVVALTEPGALHEGWTVRPSGGAVRA
jgi:galactokinase